MPESPAPSLVVCLNPTLQKTVFLEALRENEVNRSAEHYFDASGKGVNAARVICQLGGRAIHLTHAGGRFRELFGDLATGCGLELVAVDSGSEVRFCYTLVSARGGTATEIVEEGPEIGPGTEAKVLAAYAELLPRCGAVLLTGSKAAGYSGDVFPEMVRLARAADKLVVADYRGADLRNSLVHRPTVIKPNLVEFCATFGGRTGHGEQDDDAALVGWVREKMLALRREFGTTAVITRGPREILFVENGGVRAFLPDPVRPVNTIGCGDSFAAGLLLALGRGENMAAAVAAGAAAAKRCAAHKRPGFIA